jgi:hypothetical protein
MPTRKIERTALAALALAASVALIGAGVAIEPAHAQGEISGAHSPGASRGLSVPPPLLDSVPSTPAPNFNPSTPYTVPQSSETPVSPASPGSVFGSSPGRN